ncbi:MAG: type II secretion system protein [Candidatus Omnitrophica bacterium]|nr:type II secretion system protein [Candidatus Omnitrophota bacterium]
MRENRGGFTLLELLVVVIIVGILASVAMPQFGKATDRAREAEAKNVLASLLSAELAYLQEKSTFTLNKDDLVVTIPQMHDWGIPAFTAGTDGATVDTISSGDLKDGVTIKTLGDNLSPGGHNHTGHRVRGIVVKTGARFIDSTGGL